MDLDFRPDSNSLYIPKDAYRPKKRCPFCQSYFINDQSCESCQRVLNYSLIGEPFSFKSFYGLKERYIAQLGFWIKLFPFFEAKDSSAALSYKRNLIKRLKDLLLGLSSFELIADSDRVLFVVEAKNIAKELLEYGETKLAIISLMENEISDQLLIQHLAQSISHLKEPLNPLRHWSYQLLEYKLGGVVRFELLLKFCISWAVILFTALKFKHIF